jgi:glucokinase
VKLIGIDIGGTAVKAGLVDESGEILDRQWHVTPSSPESMKALLSGIAVEYLPQARAIGIGCKGIIEPETTRVAVLPGTLHYLEGLRLDELTGSALSVTADNDARAAMAGELQWGAAKGRRNALMLTLGTGVGGAILADGRLLRGSTGVAGHIGHYTIDPDGAPCICGNRGCLETTFSAKAIESEAFRAVHAGCDTALTRLPALTCEGVFQTAAAGDPIAHSIVEKATARLSAAVAGLLLIFDPEVVILGGHITEAGDALFLPLAADLKRRTYAMLRREVPLVGASSPDSIVGAAGLAFQL